ncbi:MAG: hypothetical protein JHC61_10730 [Burkholderiaceae bacterium]|nr:hypothetical protein [Burkholderiaceae bacterium]
MTKQLGYRTLSIAGTPNAWVLGMRWQTVLGQNLTAAAMKIAYQAGATHFTQADPRSTAVGFFTARGRDRRAQAKSRLYSAAAAFAQLHRHGTHIVWAELPEGNVWIAIVVDGTVQTGGDHVFTDAQAAHDALENLIERYRDAVVHGADRPGALPFQFSHLATLANTQSSLRCAAFRVSMISPIWWAVLGLVVAYFAWDMVQTWWHEKQVIERQRLEDMRTAVDAHALWQQALENWAQGIRTEGETGLTRLLDSLMQVPVNPGRWVLTEASCQPAAGTCTARYMRTHLADNNTLKTALPQAWRVSFPTLDTAVVSWALPHNTDDKPLVLGDIAPAAALERTWIPRWQALSPALQDIKLDSAQSIAVHMPNIRLPNGLEQPVELPAQMSIPVMRSFTINAPLRSLYGLALPPTTTLTQLQVRYQPDAQAKLAASRFAATLDGVLYVQPH